MKTVQEQCLSYYDAVCHLKQWKMIIRYKPEKWNSTRKPQSACLEAESHRTLRLFAEPTVIIIEYSFTLCEKCHCEWFNKKAK